MDLMISCNILSSNGSNGVRCKKTRGSMSHNPSMVSAPNCNQDLYFMSLSVTGAALHIHSSALVSVEWLVKNVTYRPHCYICFTWDSSVRFLFSDRQPFPRWDCFYWQLLETLRAKIGDPTGFDNRLSRISPSRCASQDITGGELNPEYVSLCVFQFNAAPHTVH